MKYKGAKDEKVDSKNDSYYNNSIYSYNDECSESLWSTRVYEPRTT